MSSHLALAGSCMLCVSGRTNGQADLGHGKYQSKMNRFDGAFTVAPRFMVVGIALAMLLCVVTAAADATYILMISHLTDVEKAETGTDAHAYWVGVIAWAYLVLILNARARS